MSSGHTRYGQFFREVTGLENGPYPYQEQLARGEWPWVLDIPTGLGKTAAVVVAWLWKRRSADDRTPRRLIYCLPMRVLAEQTFENALRWTERAKVLGGVVKWEGNRVGSYRPEFAPGRVTVHLLMGGEEAHDWDYWPECDAILVGTQDMLLSRALNRGYAMSRYRWPLHFALLNNDALWVLDETQLMGNGLATSVQLDLARARLWRPAMPTKSLWMSATFGDGAFETRDRKDARLEVVPRNRILRLPADAPEREVPAHKAEKRVALLSHRPGVKAVRGRPGILGPDNRCRLTLVVVNTVAEAQRWFKALRREAGGKDGPSVELVHGRMRPCDRQRHLVAVLDFADRRAIGAIGDHPGFILVATQVVEAGVDLSVAHLWSEVAPWASVVQRLGRLNRDGQEPQARAWFWMPSAEKQGENAADAPNAGRVGPYEKERLEAAKSLLRLLARREEPYRTALDAVLDESVSREELRVSHRMVIRPPDLFDLFAAEPDLAGGYTDVSRYIRSTDADPDVQVFWGEFHDVPSERLSATRDLLCPVSVYALRKFLQRQRTRAWEWDPEEGQYRSVRPADIRPGMTVLLSRATGGYSEELGWTGDPRDRPAELVRRMSPESLSDERWSDTRWLELGSHLEEAASEAERLVERFDLDPSWKHAVVAASRWHDIGKLHDRWQEPLRSNAPGPGPWAKFGGVRPFQPALRHEAASALAVWRCWLAGATGLTALSAYLVAAHHGKVRTVLRAKLPGENVFGVREGDRLPPFADWFEQELELDLRPALFGAPGEWLDDTRYQVEMPSWVSVVADLLGSTFPTEADVGVVIPDGEPRALGPYALAFLEALVIAADRRVSARAEGDEG